MTETLYQARPRDFRGNESPGCGSCLRQGAHMSEPVIEVIRPCVHGDAEPHGLGINARVLGRIDCTGGSRVRYTRQEAIAKLAIALIVTEVTDKRRGANAIRAIDALLGDNQ